MFHGPGAFIGPGFQTQPRLAAPTLLTSMPPEAPEFIVKAVLEFGDEEAEGTLVRAAALPWYEIIDWLTKDPQAAYQIDPRRWEELLAGAYERSGQFDKVILTPAQRRQGARCDCVEGWRRRHSHFRSNEGVLTGAYGDGR